jgi:serine phosphatase RsbU (regulator of sigma subunit)
MLSILRLSPAVSLFAGAASATGYAAVWLLGIAPLAAGHSNLGLASAIFATESVLMVVAGALAAGVAARVRVHVAAALREAEARREVERYQGELNLARQIQQGLLPAAAPAIAGYEVAGWNRPADETGGDFFDFLPLDDGRLAVAIADATGHGIGPALVSVEARALLRAVAGGSAGLEASVNAVHRLLCLDLPENRFVTAFCGVLDSSSAALDYLSAGQGPILLYEAATASVRDLPVQGLPLAFFPEATYEGVVQVRLAPGDALVLLTDGFYEWADAHGDAFGEERVRDLIRQLHDRPAAEIIAAIYRAVVDFAGGTRQADDLTAVIVRRTTASTPAAGSAGSGTLATAGAGPNGP